jgi:hypothetical protein
MADGDWERSAVRLDSKEMLAHVAFWDEAAVPVITYMLRGEAIPRRSWFGSGYQPAEDSDWPPDYEHNAREPAWGREHSVADVRARLLRAHEAVIEAVATISDDEASHRASYIQDQCDHYGEHLAELQGARAPGR